MDEGVKWGRRTAGLLLCLLLSACAFQENRLGRQESIDADVGYVLATLVSRQIAKEEILLPKPPNIEAHFQEDVARQQAEFLLRSPGVPQWETPLVKNAAGGEYRIVLLVPVKPGRYWLRDVGAVFYSGYARSMTLYAPYPAITVKRGEITYAGSIQVHSVIGRNIEGQPRPGKVWLEIKNDFEGDTAMMRSQDTRFAGLPISNGLK